jgi:methylenetetrahydrofolate dehydrogenase (NADP+)/methenyltetrahydrofolate cyclohydrolase
MTAQMIDGNALSRQSAPKSPAARRPAARGISRPGHRAGGRRPGQPGLRAHKVNDSEQTGLQATLETLPRHLSEADLLARIRRAERGPVGARHPGAAAAAEAHGQPQGDRDDLAGQGRRRLPRRQRRRADGRPAGLLALHALRLPEDAGLIGYDLKGKHAVVIGRSNIVGKPMALMLLQKRRHRDHLPQPHQT